jgi:hypothetical protein
MSSGEILVGLNNVAFENVMLCVELSVEVSHEMVYVTWSIAVIVEG